MEESHRNKRDDELLGDLRTCGDVVRVKDNPLLLKGKQGSVKSACCAPKSYNNNPSPSTAKEFVW
jgi:hypothetical protein